MGALKAIPIVREYRTKSFFFFFFNIFYQHSGSSVSHFVEVSQLQWGKAVSLREFESLRVFSLSKIVWLHSPLYWLNSKSFPCIELNYSTETFSLEFLSSQPAIKILKQHLRVMYILWVVLKNGYFITILLSNLWLLTFQKHTEMLKINDSLCESRNFLFSPPTPNLIQTSKELSWVFMLFHFSSQSVARVLLFSPSHISESSNTEISLDAYFFIIFYWA